MNLFKIRRGIFGGLVLISSMSLNQAYGLTVQAYANTCKTELQLSENIPGFDCERGMLMGNSLFGVAGDSQATLGGPGPTEGQRLGQVSFTNPNVKGVFMCRKYAGRNLGAEQYNDIALIVSNKSTGKTCFFQSPTSSTFGRQVPSPHDTSADTVWLNNMNPSGSCTVCHSNDPFIVTSHVITGFNRLNLTGFNPLGAYKVVQNASPTSYSPNLAASSPSGGCAQCHRTPTVSVTGSWMSPIVANVYSTAGLWNIQNKGIRRGIADTDVFRASSGKWFHRDTENGVTKETSWGQTGDKATRGDFDGDGQTDISIWRPSTQQYWVYWSSTKSAWSVPLSPFALSTDIAVPADYDGDGRDDLALYRPSTGDWFVIDWASWTYFTYNIGQKGTPVPADYDGDLKANLAIWESSTGNWYIRKGSTNFTTQWGQSGDKPVPADFTGDAIADRVVYRPSDGKWYIYETGTWWGWGLSTDIPVPADFDGDSKADLAVFRPSDGKWYIANSSVGFSSSWWVQWGQSGDQPIPMYQNK
jgi:hypothetical protein